MLVAHLARQVYGELKKAYAERAATAAGGAAPETPIALNLAMGGFAGAVSAVVTHPVDTVKSNLQGGSGRRRAAALRSAGPPRRRRRVRSSRGPTRAPARAPRRAQDAARRDGRAVRRAARRFVYYSRAFPAVATRSKDRPSLSLGVPTPHAPFWPLLRSSRALSPQIIVLPQASPRTNMPATLTARARSKNARRAAAWRAGAPRVLARGGLGERVRPGRGATRDWLAEAKENLAVWRQR